MNIEPATATNTVPNLPVNPVNNETNNITNTSNNTNTNTNITNPTNATNVTEPAKIVKPAKNVKKDNSPKRQRVSLTKREKRKIIRYLERGHKIKTAARKFDVPRKVIIALRKMKDIPDSPEKTPKVRVKRKIKRRIKRKIIKKIRKPREKQPKEKPKPKPKPKLLAGADIVVSNLKELTTIFREIHKETI